VRQAARVRTSGEAIITLRIASFAAPTAHSHACIMRHQRACVVADERNVQVSVVILLLYYHDGIRDYRDS
jgi:hypothetical protein